jgi:hypothetical protein
MIKKVVNFYHIVIKVHKLQMSTKQVKSNHVQSLIDLFVDTMPHQMKGIGNCKQNLTFIA